MTRVEFFCSDCEATRRVPVLDVEVSCPARRWWVECVCPCGVRNVFRVAGRLASELLYWQQRDRADAEIREGIGRAVERAYARVQGLDPDGLGSVGDEVEAWLKEWTA